MLSEQTLASRLRMRVPLVRETMNDIVQRLSSDIPDVAGRQLRPIPNLTTEAPPPEWGTRKRTYDIFVVIPIFNATDSQAAESINSVVRSFPLDRTCLVLYTNRSWRALPGLIKKDIDFVQFQEASFSLPRAYNSCVAYLRRTFGAREEVIVFMDDDAEIIGSQQEIVAQNLGIVRDEEYVAVSGHYYDDSEPEGFFQRSIHMTHTDDFVSRCPKPYCHGGAALMIKAKNFPAEGLPLDGLGGISLNILLARPAASLHQPAGRWFLFNNPKLRVRHPRKKNIVQWSATYLSYEIAWNLALSRLDDQTRRLWKEKLQKCSSVRKQRLVDRVNGYDPKETGAALANLLLTCYYKQMLHTSIPYAAFQRMELKTHINLMSRRNEPSRT
jgi:hypothetical protein